MSDSDDGAPQDSEPGQPPVGSPRDDDAKPKPKPKPKKKKRKSSRKRKVGEPRLRW